jgi:hypothetical protein
VLVGSTRQHSLKNSKIGLSVTVGTQQTGRVLPSVLTSPKLRRSISSDTFSGCVRAWGRVARTLTEIKPTEIKRSGADGGRDAAARLADIVGNLGGNRFWSEIVDWWAGVERNEHDSRTEWLEGQDTAQARWLAACLTSEHC